MTKKERDKAQERLLARSTSITKPQQEYIEGLLINAGYAARVQRNAYLSRMTGRDIRYVDSLKLQEASAIIHDLREQTGMNEQQDAGGMDADSYYRYGSND